MPEYRTIAVDPETYDEISRMAEQEGRTIGKQVTHLVKFALKYRVVSLGVLPHPPDADPIPVAIVQEQP